MPVNGTTNQRGYGPRHKRARAEAKKVVDRGEAYCCRCGRWIDPSLRDARGLEMWELDHTDDRSGYRGPAHRSCNRRAGAIKGNKQRGQGVAPARRRWRL